MSAAHPSLTRALAETLVDVLWLIEDCEHEQTDQDDAVQVLEGVAHVVSRLTREQQDEFLSLLATMAREESDPSRRVFLEEFQASDWWRTRTDRSLRTAGPAYAADRSLRGRTSAA